jgi:hypothetical protein
MCNLQRTENLGFYQMRSNEFIAETTTAGAIATVPGGLAPAFTRNASIYGTDDKKKKKAKKAGKYSNSVTKD